MTGWTVVAVPEPTAMLGGRQPKAADEHGRRAERERWMAAEAMREAGWAEVEVEEPFLGARLRDLADEQLWEVCPEYFEAWTDAFWNQMLRRMEA